MARIPVSITFALFKKGIAGVEKPDENDTPASDAWRKQMGIKGTYGYQVREMSMSELAAHVSTGNAMSVGIYERGHRHTKNRTGGWILGLDFEVSDPLIKLGVDPKDGYSVE